MALSENSAPHSIHWFIIISLVPPCTDFACFNPICLLNTPTMKVVPPTHKWVYCLSTCTCNHRSGPSQFFVRENSTNLARGHRLIISIKILGIGILQFVRVISSPDRSPIQS